MEKKDFKFRSPLPAKIKLTVFLLRCGGGTCENAATQLGTGPGTVFALIDSVGKAIAQHWRHFISFPSTKEVSARIKTDF